MSIQDTMRSFMDSIKSKLTRDNNEFTFNKRPELTPEQDDFKMQMRLNDVNKRDEPYIPIDPNVHGQPGERAYENIRRMNVKNGFPSNPNPDQIKEAKEIAEEKKLQNFANELSEIMEHDRVENELKNHTPDEIEALNELRTEIGQSPITPRPEYTNQNDRKNKYRN